MWIIYEIDSTVELKEKPDKWCINELNLFVDVQIIIEMFV